MLSSARYKKKYADWPLWVIRLFDLTINSGQLLLPVNRYPVADPANTLRCNTPLFITSAGRSGTTLLRSMLVAGGEIAIPPETQVVHTAVRRFLAQRHLGWQQLCQSIISLFESHPNFYMWDINLGLAYSKALSIPKTERCLARIIDEVYGSYSEQKFPGAILWGDQSPIHTFHIRPIAAVFPQAKYLHMVRDGRDAIASHIERSQYVEKEVTLEEATYRWKESIKRMQALKAKLDPAYYVEIRYEDLVTSPVDTLNKICAFIAVQYGPEMIDFWKSDTTIEHKYRPHHRNLAKPLFTSSIGKWQERLSPEAQKYILAETAPLLELLGYM